MGIPQLTRGGTSKTEAITTKENVMIWYTLTAYYPVEIMPVGFWTDTGFLWAAPSR